MIYPKTFEDKIGMTEIRAMLAAHCLSPLGKQRVAEMSFQTDAALLNEWHRQTGEFIRLMEEEDRFPDEGYYDLRPTLQRIRVEGTFIEVEEAFSLKRGLETIVAIITMLKVEARRDDRHIEATDEQNDLKDNGETIPYPALQRMVRARLSEGTNLLPTTHLSTFNLLIRRISQILDKFGHVKDTASPELAQIRRELASVEGSISRILHNILRSAQADGTVAQDVAPTMRDGRLVIPVAPALKRKIKGIVHDESATGKTVFIEPQEVVEANNRIRELEADERREVIRILRAFTDEVRPLAPALLMSYEMLADIEFVRTKAHLAQEIGATTTTDPQIAAAPLIDWTIAVHPLLRRTLEKHNKRVVPLDIELTRKRRILLISGPNAGGKSVCLKTVGLLQYMLQCGLPVTLGERSRLGTFKNIMIDIGDEQSIEDELSTYSSHLLNMKQMMRYSDPETLLLIDEFGGGTEPQIGGAIAEAVLQRFVNHGAFGIITTHYQNLKHFAEETDGVVNGAMLYDRHLMQPLFQLQIGQPGSSFAVEIARKIGIPEEVISDASDIVGRDYINADKWLQDIVRDRRYWQQKRENIHSREKTMEQTIAQYEEEIKELQRQRKEILKRAKEEAEQLISESNARIERTIREIRESQAEKEQTRRVRQQLEDFRIKEIENQEGADDDAIQRKMEKIMRRQERKKGGEKGVKSDESRFARNEELKSPSSLESKSHSSLFAPHSSLPVFVRLKGQTSVGKLLSVDGKKATVLFGQMRTTVQIDRLVSAHAPKKEETPTMTTYLSRETQNLMREKSLQFQQDIDVRGMRGDEALNAVQLFIDDAIQVAADRVRILHGTGTGALRQIIRQYLRTVPSVANIRDEHVQFGGAGITVVDLR